MNNDMKEFIHTLPKELVSHNVYYIQTFDMNDNLIDTKYGVNVMTNSGYNTEIKNNSDMRNSTYVFIGTGNQVSVLDTDMSSPIEGSTGFIETVYTSRDTNAERLNIFDSDRNILVGRRLTGRCTINYNYEWLTTDIHVSEFGEGSLNSTTGKPTFLYSHALVYDEHHSPSYFVKRPNERVIISIYRTYTVNIRYTINKLWNEGTYLFIDPSFSVKSPGPYTMNSTENTVNNYMAFLKWGYILNGRCRSEDDFPMYPIPVSRTDNDTSYNRLPVGYNCGFSRFTASGTHISDKRGVFVESSASERFNNMDETVEESQGLCSGNLIRFTEHVLEDRIFNKCNTGIFTYADIRLSDAHSVKRDDSIIAIKHYNQRLPETIEFNNAFTDDFLHPRFRNIFGLSPLVYEHDKFTETFIPVTDFNITSLSIYNALTDSYDAETFTNDASYDFRNPERGVYGVFSIDGFGDCNVFMNTTDVPIIGFNNPPSQTIYLTDTYWDPSSYVALEDNKVVPAELQHKKYIIKTPMETWNNTSRFHIYNVPSTSSGIFPIRQTNNHALVLSEQITEIDLKTDLTLQRCTYNYNKMIFASDTGWIYCCGRLIYPESDDGTGHPYEYTINPEALNVIKFTDEAIVTVSRINITMKLTDSTTPRINVYHMDPSQPEVDPNTTVTVYYDSDIAFGETYSNDNFYKWCAIMVDPHRPHCYVSRTNKVYYIDLSSYERNIEMIETNEFDQSLLSIVYGTDYLVTCHRNTETFDFTIYDVVEKDIVEEFQMPIVGTMVTHFMLGFKNMIYFQVYRDGLTYSVYMYNYESGELYESTDTSWYILYNAYVHNTGDSNLWTMKFTISRDMLNYDEDSMIISTLYQSQSTTNGGSRTLVLNADDLTKPYYFDDCAFTKNANNSFISDNQFNLPCIKKFNSGKNYAVMINGKPLSHQYGVNTGGSYFPTQSYVFDIGYIMNKNYHTAEELMANIPIPAYRMPNACSDMGGCTAPSSWVSPYYYDDNNKWFTYSAFYKNKVVVFTTFGKPLLVPIEMFLPHKMVGTTYSVQAYNNPKGIAENDNSEWLTNGQI